MSRPTQDERIHMAYVRGCTTAREVSDETGIPLPTCCKFTSLLVKEQLLRRVGARGRVGIYTVGRER